MPKTGKPQGTEANTATNKGQGHSATHAEAGGTKPNPMGVSPKHEGFIRRPAGGGGVTGNPDSSPNAG